MPKPRQAEPWTCAHCQSTQTDNRWCHACQTPRYATFAIQVAHHVLEHLQDGLSEPLAILEAMQARPCYVKVSLELSFIAQQMRLLTKDTTTLARQIAKARASRVMLEVLETGDTKDKVAVLKGIQVLGDVVEVKGETITRHVVELHEGPPPKSDG